MTEKRASLEHEIRDMHDDTGRLETELFSTMEDRTRIEDDLIGIRDHVNKLKTELFHLKIEKTNLEADLRKNRSLDGTRDSHASLEHDYLDQEFARGPLRDTELSDVLEASHESMDSENSSQMSDGHETRDTFLKTCFVNMSQVYSLMPSPENDIISEEEMSDGKEEPTLSDANVDSDSDSDEDIVITKLARSMHGARSPGNSPTKEKKFEQTSPTKGGKRGLSPNKTSSKAGKNKDTYSVPHATKDKLGSPTEARTQEEVIRDLKKRLNKAEQEVRQLRETNEDLDEDLNHKKGQLARAQKTIIDLEGQVMEEKDTREQVRQLYIDMKERCDILESKATTLRTELERALRENTVLNAQTSPKKVPWKSPAKSPSKTKRIDLRNPPENTKTSSEIQIINLWEENAELKTKLDKVSQDKVRLEQLQAQVNGKAGHMESVLAFTEDQCKKLKEEIAVLKKGKLQLGNDLSDLQNRNSDELEKCREMAAGLAKDVELSAQLNEKLRKDKSLLESAVSKMESELVQWKKDFEVVFYECERLEGELLKAKQQTDQMKNDLQTTKNESKYIVEQRCVDQKRQERGHQEQEKSVQSMKHEMEELQRLNSNLQSEIAGMSQYQQALEVQYSKAKSESEKCKEDLSRSATRLKEVENQLEKEEKKLDGRGDGKDITPTSKGDGKEMATRRGADGNAEKGYDKKNSSPYHMFYTLTGDISGSSESLEPDSTHFGEETQFLKLENTYLLQQIAEHEHTLLLYKHDLEKAQETAAKLEKELEVAKEKVLVKSKNHNSGEPSSLDENHLDNIKAMKGKCELLQVKNAELFAENSKLQIMLQGAREQKEKLLTENDSIKAETASLKDELCRSQMGQKETKTPFKETQRAYEILETPEERQSLTVQELKQSNHQPDETLQVNQAKSPILVKQMDSNEVRQLEEDLLRVTSEKLKLEFEFLNATAEVEGLKRDLEQSESEKHLMSTQLNDNIQKVANLEIRLMEMRCSNESMKGEFNHLREEKRQESYYRQEASIHKEVMEKRLEETLKVKQQLRNELDTSIEKTHDALERIERLEKQKQEEELEAEQLRQQSQELQQELQNTVVKIKEFEARAKQLEKENTDIEERIKTMRRQNSDLKHELQSRAEQNQKAKEKVNSLERKVKDMNSELKRLQQNNLSLKKDVDANEPHKKDKGTQGKVDDVYSENTRLKDELFRLQEEKEELQRRVAAIKLHKCEVEHEDNDALEMAIGEATEIRTNGESLDKKDTERTEKDTESTVWEKMETNTEEKTLPDVDNAMSAMAMMSKEKLLLESAALRFSKVQMHLEQSLSRALSQNETLKIKMSENSTVMQVLRARVHELENQYESYVKWKEIKRQITISSDSDSNSDNDSDRGGPDHSDEPDSPTEADSASQNNIHPTMPNSKKGLEIIPEAEESVYLQQCKIHLLHQEKAHLRSETSEIKIKDATSQQYEEPESAMTLEKDMDLPEADIERVPQVSGSGFDLKESNTNLIEQENGRREAEPDSKGTTSQLNRKLCSIPEAEETADLPQSDLNLLRQEKAALLAELQAVKHQYNLKDNEMQKKTTICTNLEEELRLLSSSYKQEKESLLTGLENNRKENCDIKEKLRELQEFESMFDEVRRKSNEAEKLVDELEKDLLHQMETKKELERQLLSCHGHLKEMETLQSQMHSVRCENEEMALFNTKLKGEILEMKKANENLLTELGVYERQIKSLEKYSNECPRELMVDCLDKMIQTDTVENKGPKLFCTEIKLQDQDTQTDIPRVLEAGKEEELSDAGKQDHGNTIEKGSSRNSPIYDKERNEHQQEFVHCHKCKPAEKTTSGTDADLTLNQQNQNKEEVDNEGGDATTKDSKAVEREEQEKANTDNNCMTLSDVEKENNSEISMDTFATNPDCNQRAGTIGVNESDTHKGLEFKNRSKKAEREERRMGEENTQEDHVEEENLDKDGTNNKEGEKDPECHAEKIVKGEKEETGDTHEVGHTEERDAVGENDLMESEELQKLIEDPSTEMKAREWLQSAVKQSEGSVIGTKSTHESSVLREDKSQEDLGVKFDDDVEESVEDKRMLQDDVVRLQEEKKILEGKIDGLMRDTERLRSTTDILKTQNEAVLKEQMLNDEENEELQSKLQECLKAKSRVEEEKNALEIEKAKLEIELSDAVECTATIERELLHRREERGQMGYELEDHLYELRERYSKLETVLSCVLEENSRIESDLSVLQEENRMLKNYKIMEITDSCTQFSPRTTEDESESEGRRKRRSMKRIGNFFQNPAVQSRYSTEQVESGLIRGANAPEEGILQEQVSTAAVDAGFSSSMEVHVDCLENSSTISASQSSASLVTSQSPNLQLSGEQNGMLPNSGLQETCPASEPREIKENASSNDETSEQLAREGSCTPTLPHNYALEESFQQGHVPNHYNDRPRRQRHLTSYQERQLGIRHQEMNERRESDDCDSSLEVCTNSSLVSVTDLDISYSSDFISSEDSISLGPENRGYQKLQKDLAETKCSNTLLKNELSILKRHNCEIQNQLQKFVNRNNQLKQKVCDRTISLRRTEKNIANTKEDNEGLQAQATAAKEELFKVEKEKSKLERNLASTKGENKRLKADLSTLKAEMYRTMKEMVNLQAENRKLLMDLTKLREDSISLPKNGSALPNWVSASHTDLTDGFGRSLPERSSPYLEHRANSDLTFQHRMSLRTPTPVSILSTEWNCLV